MAGQKTTARRITTRHPRFSDLPPFLGLIITLYVLWYHEINKGSKISRTQLIKFMIFFSDRHHLRPHQSPALPPTSTAAATPLTMASAETNNNNQNNESAKYFPPFSTAMAMALANSAQNQQHKSAFAPAAGTGNQHSPHPYFRSFEPPNFFAKDLFPFPPPLFPPSFFVGFSSNPPPPTYHHTAPGLTPFNLTENNPCLHRPCVDPSCSQCAPKVDSTDESAKED